jgi:hypothetical protein
MYSLFLFTFASTLRYHCNVSSVIKHRASTRHVDLNYPILLVPTALIVTTNHKNSAGKGKINNMFDCVCF